MNINNHHRKIICQIFVKTDKNLARNLSILKINLPENFQIRKYSCNNFADL